MPFVLWEAVFYFWRKLKGKESEVLQVNFLRLNISSRSRLWVQDTVLSHVDHFIGVENTGWRIKKWNKEYSQWVYYQAGYFRGWVELNFRIMSCTSFKLSIPLRSKGTEGSASYLLPSMTKDPFSPLLSTSSLCNQQRQKHPNWCGGTKGQAILRN